MTRQLGESHVILPSDTDRALAPRSPFVRGLPVFGSRATKSRVLLADDVVATWQPPSRARQSSFLAVRFQPSDTAVSRALAELDAVPPHRLLSAQLT